MHRRLARLARLDEAEQTEGDALYGMLRGPVPAAKGRSGPTMSLIRDLLGASREDISAATIAQRIGISCSTAQRYLTALARQGDIELRCTTGRPAAPSTATESPADQSWPRTAPAG